MTSHPTWRDVSYAFVVVEDVAGSENEIVLARWLAVVGMAAEPRFLALIGVAGTGSGSARTEDELCTRVADTIEGRVVVVHGASAGWRRLRADCPEVAPRTVLDSLGLARALLPGGDHSIGGLAERLSLTRPPAATGWRRARRDATLLALVFEELVQRMLPSASVSALVDIADSGEAYRLSNLGLEDGR